MFKKFFNKNVEKKIEVPQDWASYFSGVDDKPASFRLNLALKTIAPIENYGVRVWFSIKVLDPDENGLTTREEFPAICDIEDDVSAVLEEMGMIAVGALKTNGTFDLYFYAKEIGDFEERIASVMKKHPKYSFMTDYKEDTDWGDYANFLYPGEYEFQTIQNQRVLINLNQQGDNPEAEREIDHWLYFEKEENREAVISKAENIGYKVLSKKKYG